MKRKRFTNPVIPGFYPDPSVCRADDDFYLVASSFEFFPGVPIFHSRDLVHWRQIGHILDRPSQLNLDGVADSRGIYAPTIRHHDGIFYLITTLARQGEERDIHANFVCTAKDPAGPWSDPLWIDGAPGIDPSLFFDDDGRVWCHGNMRPDSPAWRFHRVIWLQEIDLSAMRLVGPRYVIADAADYADRWGQGFCNAFEAPHLYKKDNWYYLLIAAGGTGWAHAMYVFRSRSITGPYESHPQNPVMTHRHLPKETSPIHCPGHGDFIETKTGQWWVFFLATRPYAGYHNYLGRESFLAPVAWEGGWPLVSPGTDRIERSYPFPDLKEHRFPAEPETDDFDRQTLGFSWYFLRTPRERWWSLTERPGYLRLRARPQTLCEQAHPSFVARRVRHLSFSASCEMEFSPSGEGEEAGMVLYKSSRAYFRLVLSRRDGKKALCLVKRLLQDDSDSEIARVFVDSSCLFLRIDTSGRRFRFSWSRDNRRWKVLDATYDVSCLSQVVCGGFTGISVGVFAGSNGRQTGSVADFDWFRYRGAHNW